jgi:hypothetical protein
MLLMYDRLDRPFPNYIIREGPKKRAGLLNAQGIEAVIEVAFQGF